MFLRSDLLRAGVECGDADRSGRRHLTGGGSLRERVCCVHGRVQVAVERRSSYDVARTTRMFLFGLCVSGPSMHYWYRFLGNHIHGTGWRRGIKVRVCICCPREEGSVMSKHIITTLNTQVC